MPSNKQPLIHPRLHSKENIQRCNFPSCDAACCFDGAWVDTILVDQILEKNHLVFPHLPKDHQNPALWFDDRIEIDSNALSGKVRHTTVVPSQGHYKNTACIFLRKDKKCALQVTAKKNHAHPWKFKPFYCILHPLDINTKGQITLDQTDLLISEPASCLRASKDLQALENIFSEEMNYLFPKKH